MAQELAQESSAAERSTIALSKLRQQLGEVYRGPSLIIDQVLTALIAGGHVLIEDRPGVGKTTLARAVSRSLSGRFHRVQGTPDLMPSDIIGVSIFNPQEQRFVFQPGPIFADVLLVDELNRCTPRSQSALLEAMAENQVSIDGDCRALSTQFFCIATQNPFDAHGTFPLPNAQLDRFLLRCSGGYPSREDERDLLAADGAELALEQLQSCITLEELALLRKCSRQIRVEESIREYLLTIVDQSRNHPQVLSGLSTRAALSWQRTGQAWALLAGRDYVTPDDLLCLAEPVLAHRLVTTAHGEAHDILNELISQQTVPR